MRRREFLKNGISAVAGVALAGMEGEVAGITGSHKQIQTQAHRNVLTAVPIQDVTIEDSFWSPKIAVWRQTTIHDCLDKFTTTGAFDNFDRVAGRASGGHHGDPCGTASFTR